MTTAHSKLVFCFKGMRGKPHVPPYHHHPLCLHAAQLHMLLSHSPTAKSSENHAPLALPAKGQHMGKKGRHGHIQRANHKEVRQWTESSQRKKRRKSEMWTENRQIVKSMKVRQTNASNSWGLLYSIQWDYFNMWGIKTKK